MSSGLLPNFVFTSPHTSFSFPSFDSFIAGDQRCHTHALTPSLPHSLPPLPPFLPHLLLALRLHLRPHLC